MYEQFLLTKIVELDIEMSSLKLNERKRRLPSEEQNASSSSGRGELRRSLRKRIRPEEEKLTKPKPKETKNAKDVKAYYLDKKVKRIPPTLETIYEEPKDKCTIMSTRKFKRIIDFCDLNVPINKIRVKKRSMKAKQLCNNKKQYKKKISMEFLMKKLAEVDEDNLENVE